MRVTVLFALETACRIGEMLKLKWENVNLKEQYIEFLATDTKTKEFRRVPITSVAKNILIWLQKHHNPEKIKDKRVFEFFHDNEHHLSRQFQICCKRAEINDIRWHDLRHEGTSRLYEKGKNLTDMEISLITGHKTLDMLKRYTHLRPNSILSKLW
jgi:integrase